MLAKVIASVRYGDDPDIIELVYTWLEARIEPPRSEGWHPSEMGSEWWCARKCIIDHERANAGLPKLVVNHKASTKAIFDIGHALHRLWQEDYLGKMGILKGIWISRTDPDNRVDGFRPTSGEWFYEE